MKEIIFVSEHYDPIVGGSVTYVKKIAAVISDLGYRTILIVPALKEVGADIFTERKISDRLTLVYVHVVRAFSYDIIFRQDRYAFVNNVNTYVRDYIREGRVGVIHVLYGMYVMNALDVDFFKSKGIKTIVTIHNVPPSETGTSWNDDYLWNRVKDYFKKLLIKQINKRRIQAKDFDMYVVPSSLVKRNLGKYVLSEKIIVIGHGYSEHKSLSVVLTKNNLPDIDVQILTVGGIVPHKNQLKIVAIAAELVKMYQTFNWKIVGPIRNYSYYKALKKKTQDLELSANIHVVTDASDSEVKAFYDQCDIYVQISSEEGFCFTVLDAAIKNKYILATAAGAIPEIVDIGNGEIVELEEKNIADVLYDIITKRKYKGLPDKSFRIKQKFSWEQTGKKLLEIYGIA